MNWFRKKHNPSSGKEDLSLKELLNICKESRDFIFFSQGDVFTVSYYKSMVDTTTVNRDILPVLTRNTSLSLDELKKVLPVESIEVTGNVTDIQNKLLNGNILVQQPNSDRCMLIPATSKEKRQITIPENEYTVLGPKECFVESLETNLNLLRKRLPIPELYVKEIIVGKLTKTKVVVVFIKGIANEDIVNTVINRISNIDIDQVIDTTYITQMIEDNNSSVFPQLIETERPDRVAGVLSEGKIAVLCDGSPSAITGPTTLVEFFSAFEDYFLTWHVASFFRLIRLLAVTFSVMSTPLYVAVLTFHYEMIPEDLLYTLISSRSGIPFPPILEAIILELTIELLREAGSRLPSKVGQTIGIVGGIVIGTAAVDAGLTSNVLLIVVALAALASFTTPVYKMSNTIRLLRFPFLISAQLLGVMGISICFAFILIHLLKLKSLGSPYIGPVYPLRLKDLKDALFRLPFSQQTVRPFTVLSEKPVRFNPRHNAAKQTDKDIDE
ncbi:spore germination protein [Peribacillus deserti]|uniref:Spore germination protein n=1 Tax=Peribacillus deserti TaxID=673318 RepID=A0A2N5M516_9BACI|nr:spore germination protein [Peribacillus deserti]PLT29450.1 spore germination protein [Peribacillus deserti]